MSEAKFSNPSPSPSAQPEEKSMAAPAAENTEKSQEISTVRQEILSLAASKPTLVELFSYLESISNSSLLQEPAIQHVIKSRVLHFTKAELSANTYINDPTQILLARTVLTIANIPLTELNALIQAHVLERIDKVASVQGIAKLEYFLKFFPDFTQNSLFQTKVKNKLVLFNAPSLFGEDVGQMRALLQNVTKVVTLFHLETQIIDEWKTRVFYAHIKDQFHEGSTPDVKGWMDFFDINAKMAEEAQFTFFQELVRDQRIIDALEFFKKYNIDSFPSHKQTFESHLREAAEDALWEGSLEMLAAIHKTRPLPVDFFTSENKKSQVNSVFTRLLWNVKIKELFEYIKLFSLPAKIQAQIDFYAQSSLHADVKNPLRLIPYLNDPNLEQSFPLWQKKSRKLIDLEIEMDEDIADYFLENLSKFDKEAWAVPILEKAVRYYSVAIKFQSQQDNWKQATWFDQVHAVAQKTIDLHNIKQASKKSTDDLWDNDDLWEVDFEEDRLSVGLSFIDPYENHPYRLKGQQLHISAVISEILRSGREDIPQESRESLAITPEISAKLAEIAQIIDTEYEKFLTSIQNNRSLNTDDKESLLHPEKLQVQMTPLIDKVKSFTAQHLVQVLLPKTDDLSGLEKVDVRALNLEQILRNAFEKFIKIYEIDIPLYDKLYEEFDSYRENGRVPMEVYLGRDGVYAWIGRRAQDAARRRKLGLMGRSGLEEKGRVVEIKPRYIVYPRFFRDSVDPDVKRAYLEQQQVSQASDPVFYDTGYTGTIPEQIMEIMGFPTAEIEERIRLLSAPTDARRVRGIEANARAEIIDHIESNAKAEHSAEGLIRDKSGKIRHIARPTDPTDQLYFHMIKEAITRHYWLKEQLHYNPQVSDPSAASI